MTSSFARGSAQVPLQYYLAMVAAEINDRPRKIHDWKKPSEVSVDVSWAAEAVQLAGAVVESLKRVLCVSGGEYQTVPRALPSSFIAKWRHQPEKARRQAERLRTEVMTAVEQGRLGELMPFTGQTAGMIHDILPAAEIVRRIAVAAETTLRSGSHLVAGEVLGNVPGTGTTSGGGNG